MCGVPQRSFLGLLLFPLYIDDISQESSKFSLSVFGDDTSIYYKLGNVERLWKVVNKEQTHAKRWLGAIKLTLNIDKINFCFIHLKFQ